MKLACLISFIFAIIFCTGCVPSQELVTSPGQHSMVFERPVVKPAPCKYLLFLPEDFNKEQQWPMILFLHGAGERGDNIERVRVVGLPRIIEKHKDFPFIVVSPLCPKGGWWPNEIEMLTELLDYIVPKYNVDRDRIYLTGISMGGYGTWALAYARPDYFAAIAPVCGDGVPALAGILEDVPVWAFHGKLDTVVPVDGAEQMVEAVNASGGDAKITIFPHIGHSCGAATYNNSELYDWFLSHRKSGNTK